MDKAVQEKRPALQPKTRERKSRQLSTDALSKHSRDEAFAISQCLDYLEDASKSAGLMMTAHLIGLAAEAASQASASGREYINNKSGDAA